MRVDFSVAHGNRMFALFLSVLVALAIVAVAGSMSGSRPVSAQVSPLSPLTVATPEPQGESQPPVSQPPVIQSSPDQPQILPTDTPSPEESQQATGDREPAQPQDSPPPIPLGEPLEASPSLILMGALLFGLLLLVVVVFVARGRE